MKVTICDRCGDPLIIKGKANTEQDLIKTITNAINCILTCEDPKFPRVLVGEDEVDLCDSCRKELQGWLMIKPRTFKFEKEADNGN